MNSRQKPLLERLGMIPGQFSNTSVLITGAARGIGAELAKILASLGGHVVLLDYHPRVIRVANQIVKNGHQAQALVLDLRDSRSLDQLLDNQIPGFDLSEVSVVVNNAIQARFAPVEEHQLEDWDAIFHTNVRASFQIVRWAIPRLQQTGGTILNMIGAEGTPLTSIYSASKAALRSLTLSAAKEQGPGSKLRIVGFAPAITATESMTQRVVPSLAKSLGKSEEETRRSLAQNPGYVDLMPVHDCACTIAYHLAHAAEYHGQIVDPFEPLRKVGHITFDQPEFEDKNQMAGIPANLRQYIQDTASLNEFLEQRVRERTRELQFLADVDGLTGTYNRRALDEQLSEVWETARTKRQSVSLYFLDVDHFKEYNDRFGHQVGDECIKLVADLVLGHFKKHTDLVARYGGDELVVVTVNQSASSTRLRAEQLVQLVGQTALPNLAKPLSISLGYVNTIPAPTDDLEGFILAADRALYQAKHQGRGRAVEGSLFTQAS